MAETVPIVEVSSYAALMAELKRWRADDGRRILFRGQVADHPHMLTSMARRVKKGDASYRELASGFKIWAQAVNAIVQEHLPDSYEVLGLPPEARGGLGMALLQHYGFQTYWIDATTNPDVALCFALLQYNDLYPVLDADGEETGRARRLAWYSPSREAHGFLYVFDCSRWRAGAFQHGQAVDLTNLVRPGRNRVQMQKAWVIHSNATLENDGDLRPLAKAIYKFPNPLPGGEAALKETKLYFDNMLFPGPDRDPIYASLLQSRFVEISYIADEERLLHHRLSSPPIEAAFLHTRLPAYTPIEMRVRPLDLPEYHADPASSMEAELFKSFDRMLDPNFFFHALMAHLNKPDAVIAIIGHGGNAALPDPLVEVLKDAEAFLVNASIQEIWESSRSGFDRPLDDRINAVFEFSPWNFVGPHRADHAPRGVWIAGDPDDFWTATLGGDGDRFWIGELAKFEWKDGHYDLIEPERRERAAEFARLAWKLAWDVWDNNAHVIGPPGDDYRQMRYPDEDDETADELAQEDEED